MSRIYIKYESGSQNPLNGGGTTEIFELTTTEVVEFDLKGQATQSRVEDGRNYSDGFVNDNKTIRLQGTLTNLAALSRSGVPDEDYKNNRVDDKERYIDRLEAVYNSGELVTVVFGAEGRKKDNCVITNANFVRNSRTGKNYRVSLTLQQIQITAEAISRQVDFGSTTIVDKYSGKTVKLDAATARRRLEYERQQAEEREQRVNYMNENVLQLDTPPEDIEAYWEEEIDLDGTAGAGDDVQPPLAPPTGPGG